ncbi:Inositol phosphoceramide mannosyltransferase-like protein [Paramyrothecium foliicola]|nr:Inositol phosphoceramide mannosyltransferase-like protein [Paramyrothecium foliicola]
MSGMLYRKLHWPRPIVLILALATSSIVIALAYSHYRYQVAGLDRISSFLKPNTSPASLSEYEIPPIPTECLNSKPSPPQDNAGGLATALSPAELLCRPIDPKAPGIPKLFHQSWINNELPSKFQRWSKGCRAQHAGWEWVLWTDDDNLKLVQTYFPWLVETYQGLPGPIYRADFARNLYMYMFGGVYADLDTDCLRPTDEGLKPFRIPVIDTINQTSTDDPVNHRGVAVFGRLGEDETFAHSIPNAWMASSPRHPFFLLPMEFAKSKVQQRKNPLYRIGGTPAAEHITGPIALRKSIFRWKESLRDLWDEVVLLPSHVVYPYSWATPGPVGRICSAMFESLDERLCQEKLEVKKKGSLTITYWSNTHKGTGHNDETIAQVSQD